MTFTRVWNDNLGLIKGLWPQWTTSEALVELFEEKLEHLDQVDVERAIKAHKLTTGRFHSPDLDEILKLLRDRRGDKGQPANHDAWWAPWFNSLTLEMKQLATLYARIYRAAGKEQLHRFHRRFPCFSMAPELNPLELDPDMLVPDIELPYYAEQLTRWVADDEREPTREEIAAAAQKWQPVFKRKLAQLAVKSKADVWPEKKHVAVMELAKAAEQAQADAPPSECREPEEVEDAA